MFYLCIVLFDRQDSARSFAERFTVASARAFCRLSAPGRGGVQVMILEYAQGRIAMRRFRLLVPTWGISCSSEQIAICPYRVGGVDSQGTSPAEARACGRTPEYINFSASARLLASAPQQLVSR
jgi:hypothetical protein